MRRALSRADPEGRSVYEVNAERYLAQLRALDKAIAAAVATVPEGNRRLLAYHDSWPYFARRYRFAVIGAVQPASFADPSRREMARHRGSGALSFPPPFPSFPRKWESRRERNSSRG